jgi:hypothetical protein
VARGQGEGGEARERGEADRCGHVVEALEQRGERLGGGGRRGKLVRVHLVVG